MLNAAKYSQNKSNRAPKQDIKEASRKAKRARLDPSQVSMPFNTVSALSACQGYGTA